ncbi:PREDICTED: Ig-like and fibronectin type-III domain-containing protein 2 [Priapulus caudatus]|uniref:Ig-like and fibronectin type-III domain-containing protein 2 n=1 Tax=Priapulus caudatus TaxID=37621 RepID=A0ABM1DSM7_PRICU|nr:PREDICTED: Ig-like and fibronectin type-III domain-containing protein 2 [Priapulus caudatus]
MHHIGVPVGARGNLRVGIPEQVLVAMATRRRCVDITGQTAASVYLAANDATPAPARDPRNFRQCCIEQGLHSSCMPACSYDWLSPDDLPAGVLETCILSADDEHLAKLVTCGADGKNHEPCCAKKGIRQSPDDWLNPDKVSFYHVFYRKRGDVVFHRLSQNITALAWSVAGLDPGTEYEFQVESVNLVSPRLSVAQVTGEPTDAAAETVSNRPDVLACCAANGVPAFCQLKICTYDPDLFSTESTNSTLCAITYFDKAVTCFADGRDHSGCCRSRGVAHECVKYCDLSLLVPKQECITEFDKIKLCFEENYEILPGPPINIAARNITGFSAMISWDKPAKLGDSVTSYSISYKDILRSPTFRNTAEPYVIVHNVSSPHALAGLAGDSLHKVYMIAYNAHGSSLPSDNLQFRTQELQPYGNNTIPLTSLLPVEHSGEIPVLPDEIDVPPIDAPSHNVSACCIQRNVSARCHHLCSYDATASEISRIRALCADDLDTLFECWSDGRDHRQCCRDRGMATRCVEACGGELLHNIYRQRCNNVSADMLQCFEEGLDILPKRPERVRVEELNSTWLQLAWNPPRDSPGNITQYNVFHYHGNAATQPDSGAFMYVTIPPVTTSYMFTGLQPGQMYVLYNDITIVLILL